MYLCMYLDETYIRRLTTHLDVRLRAIFWPILDSGYCRQQPFHCCSVYWL